MDAVLELIRELDGAALLFVQDFLRTDWLSHFFTAYTRLGNSGILWIVISAVMLCFRPTRKVGLLALLAMLLGLLCNNYLLKELVQRPRPVVTVDGLRPLLAPPDPNSFPSGHTCAAFAFAGVLWRSLSRGWGAAALGAAALMGYSRIYVGVHFPLDVVAGAAMGLLCAWVVWEITGLRGVSRRRR